MICKNCRSEVLATDIIGNKCVHCYGYNEPYQETVLTCFYCGKEQRSLSNDLCRECKKIWDGLNDSQKEMIIKQSWDRKKYKT